MTTIGDLLMIKRIKEKEFGQYSCKTCGTLFHALPLYRILLKLTQYRGDRL